MPPLKRAPRKALKIFSALLVLAALAVAWFFWRIRIPEPRIENPVPAAAYTRIQTGPDAYRIGNNRLRKNRYGIWEMYLEGAPYERGLIYGLLARELNEKQEVVFIDQIREMIPNTAFLHVLKYFIGWFNRDIYKYIPDENLQEIYGISQTFSDKFNFIGPKYFRILNYHGAHDIGHALTDLNMVGCTSFAVNKGASADSSLLIARNFDFNMGDKFSEDKLLLFMKPDKGYAFASYSWAGFTGVVSGINEKGLTVTLNAAKSDLPYGAKEPVSLLAREILQYASNIQEAVEIASKREMFVSESLLIGSAADDKAVIIEKTPTKMDVYDSGSDVTVCANHYQSRLLAGDPVNRENIETSDSRFRFERIQELLRRRAPLDYREAAEILRDQKGPGDKFIGYGNPKSVNQLLAHHGILFKPGERKVWISTQPYQIGSFIGYDLDDVFHGEKPGQFRHDEAATIAEDPFLHTPDYRRFEAFKATRQRIQQYLISGKALELSAAETEAFIADNPESFLPYLYLGDYFRKKDKPEKARHYYNLALTKEVSSPAEQRAIAQKLKALKP